MSRPTLFVGVDWATEEHAVCALGADGGIIKEFVVKHSGPAIAGFADWLSARVDGDHQLVAVGIEIPRGAVVEMLVERGFRVFSLNPKQLDRFRDRFFPSGAKDDSKDAFVLAHSLLTDRSCYREAVLDTPEVIQLREHVRMWDELKVERIRLQNRLRDQLIRYFPAVLELLRDVDEPWFLELLERAPTPDKARRLRPQTVAKVLRKHRIRKLNAEDVIAVLRVPPVELAPGGAEAASAHVLLLIPRLRLLRDQRVALRRRLDELLSALSAPDDEGGRGHRDAEIIQSLPGAGLIVTATMLAESPQAIRERDYLALRAHGGIAPVTKQTGKRRHGKRSRRKPQVLMRQGCNGRLRDAFYIWAFCAMQCDPASRRYYKSLRARGHTHARALRSVADRLLRILVAMLRDGTLYDPQMPPRSGVKKMAA